MPGPHPAPRGFSMPAAGAQSYHDALEQHCESLEGPSAPASPAGHKAPPGRADGGCSPLLPFPFSAAKALLSPQGQGILAGETGLSSGFLAALKGWA